MTTSFCDVDFSDGLSGCRVRLSNGVVIKSCDKPYETRLSSQCKKQESFRNYNFKNIEIPAVLGKDIGSFSMVYAQGMNFSSFLEKANKVDLDFVVETLSAYFDFFESRSRPSDEIVRTKLVNKLNSMKTLGLSVVQLEKLLDIQTHLDIRHLPKSMCHGDLTFSNIIFTKNKLWFIDMLDTFIDSYLLDLAKLKQDLFYMWSSKLRGKKSLRVCQAKRYIWERLCDKKSHLIENEWFDFLDTLNILRIEPYIKDEHRLVFDEIVKRTPYYENSYSPDGGKIH